MTETAIIYGEQRDLGRYALARCVNALAARGAEEFAAKAVFQIPADRENTFLYDLKKKWKKMADTLPFFLEIRETEGGKCPAISLPCALVTAEGRPGFASPEIQGKPAAPESRETPGRPEHLEQLDILVAGYAGLEGMLRISQEKREVLAGRFAPSFLRLVESAEDQIFGLDIARAVRRAGIPVICHVGQGGIFKALWELSAWTGRGLEADLKKIPVRQETIEVCELFHINPYQLTSAGCFLLAAADGEAAAERLARQQVEACVIGRLRGDNDKIVQNGEDVRFLDRPGLDEIWKLWQQE